MAVYKRLLLSAGGGIISTKQQAEQARETATLLIGLGGTGTDAIRTIKTQVRSRLIPDDPNAIPTIYSHIRFLGVDTDESAGGDATAVAEEQAKADALLPLDDTERFSIAKSNVSKELSNQQALAMRPELNWLRYEDIEKPNLSRAGAGGIRQVGRYMLMDKSAEFMNRIESEINAAKSGLINPKINIHIFSGLSGGTGSGCFLDACYMIRSIADRVGGVTLFGYFFLPDVNLSKIPMSATRTREYIPRNGYAAMQELDYCMQLQFNGGSFVQEYQNNKKVEWKEPPVDMCHLVCATNSNGAVIPNAYDYAMNVTAEYIMDFLTESTGDFGLTSQLSNFQQNVNTANGSKRIGTHLAYCVIGASCATIPLREINTYLATELFGHFSRIESNMPTKADVEQLAIRALANGSADSMLQIYDALYRELRVNANDEYASYLDDWKFVRDMGNSELVDSYTKQTSTKKGMVETNAKNLISFGNQQSLINRVRAQLVPVMRDINRGPIFAYRMIAASQNYNLLNVIDGLIEKNRADWAQEGNQNQLRMDDYERAKSDFDNRNKRSLFDNDEKRFNDYEYYLMVQQQHELLMYVYEKMDGILQTLRKQVVDVRDSYYVRLARVLDTLVNTFRENHNVLASEKILTGTDSFAIPMMTIADLKESLDAEIAKLNIAGMMDEFINLLLTHDSEWIQEDENKITRLVTSFFVDNAFADFANRTITAFLSDKYQTSDNAVLAEKVYQEWMKRLTGRAKPLFYFNGTVWTEEKTSKLAYLSVPQTSAPIKAAAKKMYDTDHTWTTKESALTDRIYVMCSACALPLSSYNNCEEYEHAYFSEDSVGRHYYEGKPIPGMVFNDWRKLSSLTPQSLLRLDRAPDGMRNLIVNAQQLYDAASELGFFDEENAICEPSPKALEELGALCKAVRDCAASLSKPEDCAAAKQLLARLEGAKNIEMVRSGKTLANVGYAGEFSAKKIVQKDLFVSAPPYHKFVREKLNQLAVAKAEADEAASILNEKIRSIEEGGKDMENYCDALFTGVINWEGRVIKYNKVNFGIVTEMVLSQRGAEFPFANIAVYQGYLSYQAMDDSTKAQIGEQVNERLNMDAPEIYTTGAKLKADLSDEKVNAWVMIANNYAERAQIVDFIVKLKQRYQIFCIENGIA